MVTLEQFKEGLFSYLDDTFISKLPGLKKWGTAVVVDLALDSYITKYKQFLISTGCMTEDNMVDIDKLYNSLLKYAKRYGKVTEHLPFFADTTFSELDVEEIKRKIC